MLFCSVPTLNIYSILLICCTGEELYGSKVYNPHRLLVIVMDLLEEEGVLDPAVQSLLNETVIELVCTGNSINRAAKQSPSILVTNVSYSTEIYCNG